MQQKNIEKYCGVFDTVKLSHTCGRMKTQSIEVATSK